MSSSVHSMNEDYEVYSQCIETIDADIYLVVFTFNVTW